MKMFNHVKIRMQYVYYYIAQTTFYLTKDTMFMLLFIVCHILEITQWNIIIFVIAILVLNLKFISFTSNHYIPARFDNEVVICLSESKNSVFGFVLDLKSFAEYLTKACLRQENRISVQLATSGWKFQEEQGNPMEVLEQTKIALSGFCLLKWK